VNPLLTQRAYCTESKMTVTLINQSIKAGLAMTTYETGCSLS